MRKLSCSFAQSEKPSVVFAYAFLLPRTYCCCRQQIKLVTACILAKGGSLTKSSITMNGHERIFRAQALPVLSLGQMDDLRLFSCTMSVFGPGACSAAICPTMLDQNERACMCQRSELQVLESWSSAFELPQVVAYHVSCNRSM